MKILLVSKGFPSKKYPLNGIFAYDQAKAIRDYGHEVTFISLDFRSFRRWRRFGITEGEKEGIRWCSCDIPLGRIPERYHRLLGKLFLKYAYKRCFKHNKPDIIHSHFSEYESSFLSDYTGIPLVVTEHSSRINSETVDEMTVLYKKLSYSQSSQIIAVSSALAKNIEHHTGFRSIVIPNIIDTKIFDKCKKKAHVGFRLATTSNLIPLKRTFRIIEAMHILPQSDIYLDVIGDGTEMPKLKALVDNYGLSNRVIFHGTIPRDKIVKIYEYCDCFIMVSSSETFGVCYAEALSAGLPVIATKCGGPEDFIDCNSGVFANVDNQDQINDAVLYMYNHYTNYDPLLLRKKMIETFSPSSIAKQLNSVYINIVNN